MRRNRDADPNGGFRSFAQFLEEVQIEKAKNRTDPLGQCYSNVLSRMRPDLTEGLINDPFHNDEVIPEFIDEVVGKWGSGPDEEVWLVPYDEIVDSFKLAMRSSHFSEATIADICQTVEDFAVNNLGDE
jgi:hypothetical protein